MVKNGVKKAEGKCKKETTTNKKQHHNKIALLLFAVEFYNVLGLLSLTMNFKTKKDQ